MSRGRQSVWPVVPIPTGSVEKGKGRGEDGNRGGGGGGGGGGLCSNLGVGRWVSWGLLDWFQTPERVFG